MVRFSKTIGAWFLIACGMFSGFSTKGAEQQALVPGSEVELTACAGRLVDGGEYRWPALEVNAAYLWIEGLPARVPGGHFRIRAEFPKARYISWQNHDFAGNSTALLADGDIVPDPGSVNPFQDGLGYLPQEVSYTLDILDIPPGQRPAPDSSNILYGGYRIDGTPVRFNNVLYRVYVPDPGTGLLGGAPKPRLYFVVDDPKKTSLEAIDSLCARIGAVQRAYAMGHGGLAQLLKGSSEFQSSLRPPVQLDREAIGYRVVRPNPNGEGWYFNSQSGYLMLFLNAFRDPVTVIRFRPPTFPDTEAGEEITGNEDLRYWSVCMHQSAVTVYETGCLHDALISVDEDGYVRFAFSYPEDRPAIDGKPYGNWLATTDIVPIVILRQIQPNPAFSQALLFYAGDNEDPDEIAAHMQEYFPIVTSCAKEEFEADRCGL